MKSIKNILAGFFISLAFISCNEAKKNAPNEERPDTKSQSPEKEKYNLEKPFITDSAVIGVYQGIFPCVNCDGIQQTILLYKDHSFAQEQIRWENNVEPTRGRGQWRINGDKIEFFQNKQLAAVLLLKGDSLFTTMISGIHLKDSLKYMLTRKKLARDRPIWDKKKLQGVDFVGMGTEPFWNVEIKGALVSFKLADWKKPLYARMGEMEKNIDSTAYYLETGNKDWAVKILPHLCSDGMSDFIYEYKVEVTYDGKTYNGCGIKL